VRRGQSKEKSIDNNTIRNTKKKSINNAEREVIAHCYFADLSMEETSQLLGMPIGTVKTHSQRGLKKLREALSAWQTTSKGKVSQ
jgi:RNA polymerase sigma-70 factor (ECF subfamily)